MSTLVNRRVGGEWQLAASLQDPIWYPSYFIQISLHDMLLGASHTRRDVYNLHVEKSCWVSGSWDSIAHD